MMITYTLLSGLLLAGALYACLQRHDRQSLPQQVLLDRLSEEEQRRRR